MEPGRRPLRPHHRGSEHPDSQPRPHVNTNDDDDDDDNINPLPVRGLPISPLPVL